MGFSRRENSLAGQIEHWPSNEAEFIRGGKPGVVGSNELFFSKKKRFKKRKL